MTACRASGTIRIQDDMAGIADRATCKIQEAIADHKAGPQARADRDRHQPRGIAVFAKVIFRKGRHVEILFQADRQMERGQQVGIVNPDEGRRIGIIANGAMIVR